MGKTIELQLKNLKAMREPSTYRFSSDREKYFVDLVGLLDSLVKELEEHKVRINKLETEVQCIRLQC